MLKSFIGKFVNWMVVLQDEDGIVVVYVSA
jgi:hypothetical protein